MHFTVFVVAASNPIVLPEHAKVVPYCLVVHPELLAELIGVLGAGNELVHNPCAHRAAFCRAEQKPDIPLEEAQIGHPFYCDMKLIKI